MQAGPRRLAAARASVQHPCADYGRPLPTGIVINVFAVAVVVNPVVLVKQQVDRYGVPPEVNQRVAHRRRRDSAGDVRAGLTGNVRDAGCRVGCLKAQAQRGPLSAAFAISPAKGQPSERHDIPPPSSTYAMGAVLAQD